MTAPSASRVQVHIPSRVVLPESLNLERTYPRQAPRKPRADGNKTVEREVSDTRTLIYDLFRSPDGRKLHAIGPDPRNLGGEMGAPTISVDGEKLSHRARVEGVMGRLNPKTRLLFLEAKLPAHLASHDRPEVQIKWRNFAVTVAASPAPPPSPKPLMTLTTIQKNYPLQWIRDWAHYHHRVHGVERIVLYDNGSDDFDQLLEGLAELDEGLQVDVVRWPYPFGLYDFRYCQQGALNHCYLRFGGDTSYFLNFDLDEYLVNLTGAPLAQHLERSLRGRVTTLLATLHVVPNLPTAPPAEGPPRALHFKHRERMPRWHSPHRTKTLFTPRNHTFIGNHDNNPVMPRWLARLVDTRSRLAHHLARKRLAWLPFRRRRHVPLNELYFNHYKGLNTGWKIAQSRLERPDPAVHELDPVMPALLERAGLADGSAE